MNLRALNSWKRVNEWKFHPTERAWGLGASWTNCAEFVDTPCKIYKELYLTKDMGANWIHLKDYVYDFDWGFSKIAASYKYPVAPERILITHDPTATGHQNSERLKWSNSVNLYFSDDFFKSKKLLMNGGNAIIRQDHYMFIARSVDADNVQKVKVYTAMASDGYMKLKRARLPYNKMLPNSFTVMDATEHSVFLHVQNHGEDDFMGDIYTSDWQGRYFALSLDNVLRGQSYVDFEKINSLQGVYLANRYSIQHKHMEDVDMDAPTAEGTNKKHQALNEEVDFIDLEEEVPSRMTKMQF